MSKSIFIETNIEGKTQKQVNQQFDGNFEIVKEKLQPPSCVRVLPPNKHGIVFVEAGVVMFTRVDIDYDNPEMEACKKHVLNDFSSKILTLFKENPFGLTFSTPHCMIYKRIHNIWFNYFNRLPSEECKKIFSLSNFGDNIAKYVQEYIADYMSHNYIGRDVKVPTEDDIRNWCGGGEFPFLEVYLVRERSGDIFLCYYITR